MKQLELKHVAPYLPYGVEIYKWDAGYEKPVNKCHLIGIDGNEIIVSSYDFKSIHCGEKIFTRPKMNTSLSITKLVLRPLSDLTEEIEHNGKKFVPIIELAKEFHIPDKYTVTHYDDIKDYGYVGIKVNCYVENSTSRYSEFSIHSDELILHNDYRIVEKLFSWHFDVFGLIDAGLAININTIK